MGSHVTCVDIDQEKIDDLKKGILPTYEPELKTIVLQNYKDGFLKFSSSLQETMQDSDIYFIAVGTPPGADGSADLRYVLAVAKEIGKYLNDYAVIINKSTVPVGTADKVKDAIQKELDIRGADIEFDVVSNPEFLKEGAAVNDFMRPDRIIIGTNTKRARKIMQRLYAPFSRNHDKIIFMNVKDAEFTKYAANALLATKISFMNEIANLCELTGVDVENVRRGIGSDKRIGYSFIYPGCGYGGSCFPKDVRALISNSLEHRYIPKVLQAVEERNNAQKQRLAEKIINRFGANLSGKAFGVWGLAFKPGTDDMREASSIALISRLIAAGAAIKAYDPIIMNNTQCKFPSTWFKNDSVTLTSNPYDALRDVDAMILVTEWKQFRQPDFSEMKRLMKNAIIYDGRNQYDPEYLADLGFEYFGIGREGRCL